MSTAVRLERNRPLLVPLAELEASTGAGLTAAARAWLRAHPGARAWRALARALARRAASRSWPWRAVAVVQTAEELEGALTRFLERGPDGAPGEPSFFSAAHDGATSAPSRHAFVIGGTGAQWPGMGQSLFGHRAFRQAMTECDAAFSGKVDFAPSEMLSELVNQPHRLEELHIAAICNFALCFALDRQLRAWGVRPSAIAGHSMGEIVGAALAGALSLHDAAAVMVAWCQVQRDAQPGEMLVVGLPAAEALALREGELSAISLAACNSPRSTTLAGEPAALAALRDRVVAAGHRCRLLRTGGAFHSHLMEPLRAPLLARLPALAPRPPELAFYSAVGRGPAGDGGGEATRFTAEHWWRNLRNPVDFEGAVRRLAADGHDALWELGPHPTLSASIAECVEGQAREPALFATLQRERDAAACLLASVGRYYAGGGALAWDELYQGDGEEAEAAAVELGEVTAIAIPGAASSPGSSAAALWAAPVEARRARLLREVTTMAAELLGVPAGELRAERSWLELGLESLHAVKLKARLQRELQLEVPLVRFLSGEPLHHFVDELLRQLAARPAEPPPAPPPEDLARPAPRAARDAVGALGADEVDALLASLVRRCPPDELAALLREVEVAS